VAGYEEVDMIQYWANRSYTTWKVGNLGILLYSDGSLAVDKSYSAALYWRGATAIEIRKLVKAVFNAKEIMSK
jgi:hypothetical protein